MIEIHFLPAQGGDFFWLRYGQGAERCSLVIDSGYGVCKRDYCAIMRLLEKRGEPVEAIILTHPDSDHIGGFLQWLADKAFPCPPVRRILFNTGKTLEQYAGRALRHPEDDFSAPPSGGPYSPGQAVKLLDWLKRRNLTNCLMDGITMESPPLALPLGAEIRFISPSWDKLLLLGERWEPQIPAAARYGAVSLPEDLDDLSSIPFTADASVSNGTSLAFLFLFQGHCLAFLGDAHPDVCATGLTRMGFRPEAPCRADLVKLSHHGSPHNLTENLLNLLPSAHFLLSVSPRVPPREQKITLARILAHASQRSDCPLVSVYRNCSEDDLLTEADRKKYLHTKLELYQAEGAGAKDGFSIGKGLMLYGKQQNRLRPYQPHLS